MAVLAPPHYPDNPSSFPMQGGCACGQIRYRINRAPLVVHCCHCTSCQRETGTAFAVNIIIEASDVTMLPPAEASLPACPKYPDIFPSATPPLLFMVGTTPEANRQVTQAELICTPSESGQGQTIARCPTCHVAVWSEYSAGPLIKFIRGGTLDRAWLVAPDLHIYTRSRRTFVSIQDGKPQFDEYYDRKEVWRPESLERWAALLPDIINYREGVGKSQ